MNKLLQFFLRFSGTLVFILLEVVCFFLIIQYNTNQNRIFFSSSNRLIGTTLEIKQNLQKYFYLSETIKGLKKENASLRDQLNSSYYQNKTKRDTIKDEDLLPKFSYIPATITAKSILGNNNHITLNRGTKQGVKLHMGVMSDKGIIGIVTGVSKHYAKVMSILHRQTSISASIKRNQYFGSIVWKTNDYQKVNLEAIPKHVSVQIGDTVETSGYSNLFPKGIMIGTIESFYVKKGSNNYSIEVKLDENLLNLQNVYVVDNLMKEEIKQVQTNNNE